MEAKPTWLTTLYRGLESLEDYSFPKTCNCCGRTYATVESFIRETEQLHESSGLQSAPVNRSPSLVGLYRNCRCRSTLMIDVKDRRDRSPRGLLRRQQYGLLLEHLERAGLTPEVAHRELRTVISGYESDVLASLGFDIRSTRLAQLLGVRKDRRRSGNRTITPTADWAG